ncbi:MAG: hypothetical protein ILP12_07410, partial [Lachnospiraceae bacterium]|nr:hypothetical protein [Lachnospiraceae bacterium]
PEIGPQTLSLYFNGENMWLASDGRADILRDLPAEEAANMAEALPAFLSGKYRCWKEEAPPRPEGVYARSSFNERCDLIYERPCNIMDSGYDPTSPVSYDTGIIAEDFLPYVNEYNSWVTGRGAVLLFTFTPVNRAGIREGEGEAEILAFAEHVIRQLDCPVIGDPRDLVLDPEWFYDSNVHCNSAGTLVYTRLLAEAVKAWQGDTSPTRVPIPEKPPMQGRQEEEQGEDADAGCFVYEETERGYVITGLTAQGASRQTLTVPVHTPDGKAVRGLSASAFAGNTVIREIRLQSNIRALENHSFDGCTALVAVYLAPGEAPSYCQVDPSGGLTAGAPHLRIYVEKDKLTDYLFNYFWSGYGSVLEGY